jgi:hypothetical protein
LPPVVSLPDPLAVEATHGSIRTVASTRAREAVDLRGERQGIQSPTCRIDDLGGPHTMRSPRFLAALALAVLPLPAQRQIFIVDAAGGAGARFTDLPTAVAAVPDGSVLLLRLGASSSVAAASPRPMRHPSPRTLRRSRCSRRLRCRTEYRSPRR